MSEPLGQPGRTIALENRRDERRALVRLVNTLRAGESQALVLRGDPGVGKTVLLDHLAELATGCRVMRVTGVQSEMELAFAGLYQLCAPMLDRLDGLAAPRREALRVAFGLSEGPVPDRFLIGLAVLGLLSEVATERPLLSIVDDHQWLDQASAQALGFAARRLRLRVEPVGLVFGTRVADKELEGLPELLVTGLQDADARELLDSALNGPLDSRVRDQIVAETRGNPLALLELPKGLTPAQLAGGFGLPAATSLSGVIEKSFLRQLEGLPPETRRLLQLAAADPSGDSSLVLRAAARLHIPLHAATAAAEAGLADFGARVRFRHPLLRSAAYRSASVHDRQAVHLALAEATDPAADPDRRAWHRAQAASGPDEEIAADLERSAGRARARGGFAAAAAFLQRAALLSVDPVRRTERILAAAQSNLGAGAFSTVLDLLATAEAGPLDELQSTRVDLLRAQVAFASGPGSAAAPLLLNSARRLEALDRDLACETYITAWGAAHFAGRLATGASLQEVSLAARRLAPPVAGESKADLILDALTLLVTEGPSVAAPVLRKAYSTLTPADLTQEELLRWGWFIQTTATPLWEFDAWREVISGSVQAARDLGALDQLPILLSALGTVDTWVGDFEVAESLIAEHDMICEATGIISVHPITMLLAAVRGDRDVALPLIEAGVEVARAGGQGIVLAYTNWVSAILHLGLGHYERALAEAVEASLDTPGLFVSLWVLPELIEAAVRTGDPQRAHEALVRLAVSTQAAGNDVGLGLEARARALLAEGDEAERWYREAIERLGRTALRPDLARAHLVYGEWLRRENRRVDARAELRTAHEMLAALGCAGFAERARRELLATGERVRKRTVEADITLTAQEAAIVRLAREGRTNPEIGAQLFISARTVEWHLRKVFGKLGITSRRELNAALGRIGYTDPTA
ncbi:MAG TPA: AAA family ATPase [Actinocrinis sp.]|uniref:helix-turn-helix transcriptional regulator n=1 Tax=Actinocrinis sp. TaxID=1920516 RepID=UPI002DDC9F95|nr:AAA family ATPase [Actinocrinis sp.]HEV3173110.1 AAA family ATPase [Actinocrinis sp.]